MIKVSKISGKESRSRSRPEIILQIKNSRKFFQGFDFLRSIFHIQLK
jgi:hypothetical protein